MKRAMRAALTLLMLLHGFAVAEVEIRGVRHDRDVLDRNANDQVTIRFELSQSARVTLNLFDGRDLLIRKISNNLPQGAGEHSVVWDARDQDGRPVPPGAYHYTLVAETESGSVEHDLTDLTGGKDLQVWGVEWDQDHGTIHYVLPENARVNIRLGLKDGGPLLRTLINWVDRPAGTQTQAWDGKDASGTLDLSQHPQLLVGVQAFSLSDNTILVGPHQDRNQLIDPLPWGEIRREVKRTERKRMYAHAQQSMETRGDFEIQLTLPESLTRNEDGIPIVSGVVPVRLTIDDRDRVRALARRFEPVFFLDGAFVFENEAGFLPTTWNWDTGGVNPGVHYLTANLRGYEGNFGIATLKVVVPEIQGGTHVAR